MEYKLKLTGLLSTSLLLASCVSLQDAPGYYGNQGYYPQTAPVTTMPNNHPYYNRSTKPALQKVPRRILHSQPPSTEWASKQADDVELIIGKHQYYRSSKKSKKRNASKDKGVALSFERASIREVIKVILGDILKLNYTVEPGVDGEVTINTSDPIPKDSLIATLESLLQVHGAVLYLDPNGTYRIAPRSAMKGRGFVPDTSKKLPPGYGLKIIPLKYIPAAEMQKILEPLANPDAFVRVDTNRNLLVLAGSSNELHNLIETINTFDVDVLQGMSVGMYQIHNVEADVVAKNLDALFGESGNSPMAGMIKIMPIEHLNSLMIISASPDYLKHMKSWIDRFDQVKTSEGQQLYVYNVQNGDAEHLADMLTQIFSGQSGQSSRNKQTSSLAPGLTPSTVSKEGGNNQGTTTGTAQRTTILNQVGSNGLSITPDPETRIVADKENNSLMIMASKRMYEQIIQALKRIDVPPMQVLIEASIMEVSLSDNLEYGLQWFFKSSLAGKTGGGFLDLDSAVGLSPSVPGFSYSLTDATGQILAVLNMLASDSKLNVISSPSILVLDNQPAEIRVGNQQPVFTGSSTTDGGVVTQGIQFKDTGVSLKVTPRVNANGMVTMDLAQEVTDVGEVDQATGQRSFLQRNIKSNIAVKSGETVILGGLIRDNQTHSEAGLPGLYKIPVVGSLFGGTTKTAARTELLVLITPTAIKNQKDLYKSGEELRNKMKRLLESDPFGTKPYEELILRNG